MGRKFVEKRRPAKPAGGGGPGGLKKEILGVMFDDLTREEAVQAGAKLLEEDKFHYVVTPNPEFILAAGKETQLPPGLRGPLRPSGEDVQRTAQADGQPRAGVLAPPGHPLLLLGRPQADKQQVGPCPRPAGPLFSAV